MKLFNEYMDDYKRQLEKGSIQKAYQGLMEYVLELKAHFQKKHPDYFVSGGMYYGYMDMTYFAVVPKSLSNKKLKIAIVFLHEQFRFEVWLAGYNKQVQARYWKLFNDSDWKKYRVPLTTKGADSIIEYTLVENPDFSDLKNLTSQIEKGTLKFIKDIESFIVAHSNEHQ
jgi:hypothetical protein